MNLIKVSAVAEILSSIAVVCTLLLLLVGVKENTKITRVSSYQSTIEQMNDWTSEVTSDPKIFGLFSEYIAGNMPTERSDTLLLLMTLNAQANIHEVAFYAHQDGIIGDQHWERILRDICQARSFQVGLIFEEAVANRLTIDFANHMNENCEGFIANRIP